MLSSSHAVSVFRYRDGTLFQCRPMMSFDCASCSRTLASFSLAASSRNAAMLIAFYRDSAHFKAGVVRLDVSPREIAS